MTPAAYLASLTGLRLAAHVMKAAKAGRTPLEHAAFLLTEQARLDAVHELLTSRAAQWAAIRRHARRHDRSFA